MRTHRSPTLVAIVVHYTHGGCCPGGRLWLGNYAAHGQDKRFLLALRKIRPRNLRPSTAIRFGSMP